MTKRELIEALEKADTHDNAEVRVVFHGRKRLSFNFATAGPRRLGPNNDFLVVVEER